MPPYCPDVNPHSLLGPTRYAQYRDLARVTIRKFDFDTSAVERLTREAEEAALRQIEREQVEGLENKVPYF